MTSERVQITPQLAIGVFFMLAGILMTLDRLRILSAASTLRYWPVALVVLGAWMIGRNDSHGRFWGTVWLLVGIWLLLNSLGVLRVGFWDLVWPVLIIWLGVSLIRQTLERTSQPGVVTGQADGQTGGGPTDGTYQWAAPFRTTRDAEGTVALFALMGESKRVVIERFRGGEMTAVMGGCVLDLRQATLAPGEQATVSVFGLMAGHEIWVPGDWAVLSHIVPVMGGFEDKRLPNNVVPPGGENRPRLVLKGVLVMGGLEIKS